MCPDNESKSIRARKGSMKNDEQASRKISRLAISVIAANFTLLPSANCKGTGALYSDWFLFVLYISNTCTKFCLGNRPFQ